ncbi:MAG: hypothetical protein AAF583_05835, partial [Pseudomonadota bacterium]
MNVTILSAPRQGLTVPEGAIEPLGSKSYVYVATEQAGTTLARKSEVTLGSRFDGRVELVSGVSEDDLIIVEGLIGVRDGGPINITNEDIVAGSSDALDRSGGGQTVSTIRR